ncbi:MAG: Asp-tRNA(Asn)/Glu-tRNA(Gln) amidotransferase subunit GatA [Candidatus Jorgensenbacteria bacterium]|nr:Asp-tRNA(Asn)/Glu-tRNA(Gln) amidotransferase subunit GatA [Candidatus Jorgensenbacteria bacterium]
MNLDSLTISSFSKSLRKKEFSAREATDAFLRAIKDKDEKFGAYLTVFEHEAIKEAEIADEAIASGDAGALTGVPLAIKDSIVIEGARATAASKILKTYKASYDATVIKKLKGARAVFLGKTNLDEFAMGSSTENSGFQITKNPHDLERVPGGSSGGSAAAVSGGLALAALGSDTGGSIRQPAAFCGVVGLKPTYGAVSRFGLMAMASSLDQIGPITKTVEDAAILFNAIRGKDEYDATSVDAEYDENLLNPDFDGVKKLTIGIPKEYFVEGMDAEVKKEIEKAIQKLKDGGFKIKEISLPHTKYALSTYYIVMPAEVSANMARYDGIRFGVAHRKRYGGIPEVKKDAETLRDLYFKTRGEGFGEEVKRRILLGTFVLSAGYYDAYYAKAQKVRKLITEDFKKAFNPQSGGVDVILSPATPTQAFKIGEKTSDPMQMYLSDVFTVTQNLVGVPALSLPVKQYKVGGGELPIGFQLVGRHFREADILGIGKWYEQN